ncbi:TrkH family potassium uptake protein [Rhodobacter ferrooxidans]|uniref:Trk system potassium uptake protein n=1 Tax=Rhodobacter ferrooxidans TaxID=371731 RepID=C8S0D0_9RHOB|nr:TrkH family potassium uptake protein [Rhodobacter sp. SW2]EEW25464.1 cation transporter [Rhodobacter sp. SW2]
MLDLRPAGYIIGNLLVVLGLLMLIPAAVEWAAQSDNAMPFVQSSFLTTGTGLLLMLAMRNSLRQGLNIRIAFVLTLGIWIFVPMFAALPFIYGAPWLGFTDAYFEAVSGITTTGSTVVIGLDFLPPGMNLWRGMLNWMGGLGIAFLAMIFLPVMRVGGMQFFRTEGFDTFGKVLPRASDIALSLLGVYAGLTVICAMVYSALGMTLLDAVVHGMASIATGGFSPSDMSFNKYRGAMEYAGTLFMILGSLPYIRYVQLMTGTAKPLFKDLQVRSYLLWIATATVLVALWQALTTGGEFEPTFREALFNLTSIISGTGFFSGNFGNWGGLALLVAFVLGIIGGCSGSSSGALTVFRVQLAGAVIVAQVRRVVSPNQIAMVKYGGRTVEDDVMNALILFVSAYILTLGVLSVAITLAGVDMMSGLFGIWSSMGNIGYGIGPMVAPTGTYIDFPTAAKWLMILAMLMGRLSLMAVLIVLLPRFWRA